MKTNLIFSTIYLISTLAFSQAPSFPIDSDTKKIAYSEVVTASKASKKATIYTRVQNWAKSKNYLVKNKQAAGTFATKGGIIMVYPGATTGKNERGSVEFICTVYCKDGKYKYVISNLKHVGENGRGSGGALEKDTPECGKFVMPLSSWALIKQKAYEEMPKIIESLKQAAIGAPVAVKKKNPADF